MQVGPMAERWSPLQGAAVQKDVQHDFTEALEGLGQEDSFAVKLEHALAALAAEVSLEGYSQSNVNVDI